MPSIKRDPFLLIRRGNWQIESKQVLAVSEYVEVRGCGLRFLGHGSLPFLSFWELLSYQWRYGAIQSVRKKGKRMLRISLCPLSRLERETLSSLPLQGRSVS